jgi:hypothetical protein
MKKSKYLIPAALCIAAMCSCSHSDLELERSKDAVRDYLKKNQIYEYTEKEWGTLDSVFSPYGIERAFSASKKFVEADIAHHELSIAQLKYGKKKDPARLKTLTDSVALLRDSLISLDARCLSILQYKQKNRIGLPLVLTYKTPLGLERTDKYIFVFEKNSRSVSHLLDEYGNPVE